MQVHAPTTLPTGYPQAIATATRTATPLDVYTPVPTCEPNNNGGCWREDALHRYKTWQLTPGIGQHLAYAVGGLFFGIMVSQFTVLGAAMGVGAHRWSEDKSLKVVFGAMLGGMTLGAVGGWLIFKVMLAREARRVRGLDAEAAEKELTETLGQAVQTGDANTLSFLADMRENPFVSTTALYEAVENKQAAVAAALLELAKSEKATMVNALVPGKGMSAFRKAAMLGDAPVFAALLGAGGDLESRAGGNGLTVAALASENPDLRRHIESHHELVLMAV